MKTIPRLIAALLLALPAYSQQPSLRQGVSVQMASAPNAAPHPEADQPGSVVLALTAAGKLYNGIDPVTPESLANLSARTVYLKADARAPYQSVLSVLDALRGKSVVLLAASPPDTRGAKIVPPYGIRLTVSR